jgi:hypothetical protein
VTGRPELELADAIALAILEHGPSSCAELARLVVARKADVLAALKYDPRLEHTGAGVTDRLLTAREVGERLRLSTETVLRWTRPKSDGTRRPAGGAALRPSSGNPARRGFHPHAPLFGPGSPAPVYEA